MSFVNTLKVEPIPGSDKRKLLDNLVWIDKDLIAIVVKKGFITDYASIPRILWSVFPRDSGDSRRASVLHDWLYSYHLDYTRVGADMIFREALKHDGAGIIKRWLLWIAVRLVGWRFW